MRVGASRRQEHARRQAGVDLLQVHLGGMRSAGGKRTRLRSAAPIGNKSDVQTYIWENLKRASKLMLRSNAFMVRREGEIWGKRKQLTRRSPYLGPKRFQKKMSGELWSRFWRQRTIMKDCECRNCVCHHLSRNGGKKVEKIPL